MPIKQTKKGWYWGSKGPFNSKKKAQEVAQAAYASGYQKSFKEGNITKLIESIVHDLRKENGGFNGSSGTVFTSTNSGIFTPTYGRYSSTRKRKKKISDKKKGQGLISAKKRSGVEKLQRWMTDRSPVKKLKKENIPLSKRSQSGILTGSSSGNQTQPVNNIMRIDWQKPHKDMIRHKEDDPPKSVERAEEDENKQDLSVIEQNDFQRKVTEMDDDNKRKTRGRDTKELDGEASAAAGVMQFSKQPNKFGNPQDDELLRGAKKDKSKEDDKVDLELDANKPLHSVKKALELADKDGISIFEALRKVDND